MLVMSLVAILTLEGGAAGTSASRNADLVRAYIAAHRSAGAAIARRAIPAWARKYNVNCSACHAPVVPSLNEAGQKFKWAGYRMPEEIGENVEVGKVQNYLAGGLAFQYDWEKTKGEATRTSGFSLPGVTMFYAGPFGRHMSGFLELEHGPESEVERVAQVSFLWGKEKSFGGFRVGQMHYLAEWGVAGFDRTVGITPPMAIEGPITAGVPFALGEHQLGLEAYYVSGSNRLSGQVLNGVNREGMGAVADADLSKDFVITDQYLLDHKGSGIQGMAYFGTIRALDQGGTNANIDTHYWRLGVTASKYFDNLELLGTVLYAKDSDLPTEGTEFGNKSLKGVGWWLSAQYSFVMEKETSLTLFTRYERVNPNTSVTDAANRRFVLGAVMPINLPQYLRWSIEYRRDLPQGGAAKTNAIATQLWLNF